MCGKNPQMSGTAEVVKAFHLYFTLNFSKFGSKNSENIYSLSVTDRKQRFRSSSAVWMDRIIHKISHNTVDCDLLQRVDWQHLGYLYKRRLAIELFKVIRLSKV